MSKISIIFQEKGRQNEIFEVDSESSFSDLIQKYYKKLGISKKDQTKSFVFGGTELSPDESKKISELNLKDKSEIKVELKGKAPSEPPKEEPKKEEPPKEESKKEEPPKEEAKGEEPPKGETKPEEAKKEEEKKPEETKPSGKAEKKVRKALSKLGMVKVEGVNRVTMKQKDSYILYVKDPEVFSSPQNPNSFIIFGEMTFEDHEKKLTQEAIETLKKEGEKLKTVTEKKEEPKVEVVPEGEELSEEGLEKEAIETVMNEGKCTRQQAIKALRAHNGDPVEALLEVGQ